jgi:O-antigen ligase
MTSVAIQPPQTLPADALGVKHLVGAPSPFLGASVPADIVDWPSRGGFVLLLLATAALLIRPGDLLPALDGWPVYELLVIGCLVLSLPRVLGQLSLRSLSGNAITICVLALVPAVILSHLTHLNTYDARLGGIALAKVCIYYLLVVALVDSQPRLRLMLLSVTVFVFVLTILALLQYHGALHLPALGAVQQNDFDPDTGKAVVLARLCSIGVFNDPNDLSLVLTTGIGLCAYWACEGRNAWMRVLRAAPVVVFAYALALTHSRGGFAAALVGVAVFLLARFGWRNALLLSCLLLPVLLLAFSGRQTNLDIYDADDTFQGRLRLWSEALDLFRSAPLFGIGQGKLTDAIGQVAHNSYLHAFTELGFVGGTLFLGAFFLILLNLVRAASEDHELARLRPYILGTTAAYAAGLLSLSRTYTVPAYLTVGIATAYLRLASPDVQPLNVKTARLLTVTSIVFLAAVYLFVRIFVRW